MEDVKVQKDQLMKVKQDNHKEKQSLLKKQNELQEVNEVKFETLVFSKIFNREI